MGTPGTDARALFLHHSTGGCIWAGGVPEWFARHNAENGTSYEVVERAFPKAEPYGWANYPYDYWNIWVRHAGDSPFQDEPTLEMLTADFGLIIFKHCFPVANVQPDTGRPDIASPERRIENYKLQYGALKAKLHEFPDTRFLLWTGAALTAGDTSEENAARARTFFQWVKTEWDEPGDNVFLWDFFQLETEGGLYLKDRHARATDNSHPNDEFSSAAAPLFARRVVDVLEGRGDGASLTGKSG